MALYFGFNEQEEYVPPSELIEGLVSKNALTFIYAHPGSGKSIFAMEGSHFLGIHVHHR
jgi:hypothetical protein